MTTKTRLAILEMDYAVTHMRFVTTKAERDNARDGWLSDYWAEMKQWQELYDRAKEQVQSEPPSNEMPCCHEWYQGQCVHCEISAKQFRNLPTHSGHV